MRSLNLLLILVVAQLSLPALSRESHSVDLSSSTEGKSVDCAKDKLTNKKREDIIELVDGFMREDATPESKNKKESHKSNNKSQGIH